jgi:AraC-like DNA-binding protein
MNSSHIEFFLKLSYAFCMKIDRESNRIPRNSAERFIPAHLLEGPFFSNAGLITGGITRAGQGFVIKRPTRRRFHILIIGLEGTGRIIMEDDTESTLVAGDIFFSNAEGQGHIHEPASSPWVFIWFQFNAAKKWLKAPFEDWGIIRTNPSNYSAKIKEVFESIINEELYTKEANTRLQELYCEELLIYLERELYMKDKPRLGRYRDRMNKLWQAVSVQMDKTWTLDEMAERTALSRAQFSRLCVSLYGKSPGVKVREIKMEHSLALLRHFDCNVSEVAEMVGYEDVSNFSAAFKKYFGFPPGQA